jgi:hypothetical protein
LYYRVYNTHDLQKAIDFTLNDFAFHRPNAALKGLTPYKAYTGSKISTFSKQKKEARNRRVEMNKIYSCQKCLF